jgi:AcrR family transcriptional regulator
VPRLPSDTAPSVWLLQWFFLDELMVSDSDSYKRQKVAQAAAELVREVGLSGLTVRHIIQRGKMACCTFYELFENRADVLRFAVALGNDKLRAAIEDAASEPGDANARMERVVKALLAAAEADPALTALCLAQGDAALEPTTPTFDPELLAALAKGLQPETRFPAPFPCLDELLACGVLSLVAERLNRGQEKSLGLLSPELIELIDLTRSRPSSQAEAGDTGSRRAPLNTSIWS